MNDKLSAEKIRELVAKAFPTDTPSLYREPELTVLKQELVRHASAIADAIEERDRLRKALDTIANPRRGMPEEHWDVEQIGDFARLALAQPAEGERA